MCWNIPLEDTLVLDLGINHSNLETLKVTEMVPLISLKSRWITKWWWSIPLHHYKLHTHLRVVGIDHRDWIVQTKLTSFIFGLTIWINQQFNWVKQPKSTMWNNHVISFCHFARSPQVWPPYHITLSTFHLRLTLIFTMVGKHLTVTIGTPLTICG